MLSKGMIVAIWFSNRRLTLRNTCWLEREWEVSGIVGVVHQCPAMARPTTQTARLRGCDLDILLLLHAEQSLLMVMIMRVKVKSGAVPAQRPQLEYEYGGYLSPGAHLTKTYEQLLKLLISCKTAFCGMTTYVQRDLVRNKLWRCYCKNVYK
jgi:hypothetical protein